MLDAGRSEAEIPRTREYWILDARYSFLDAGQIVDDLAPISRVEGDIFYRGCWVLDGTNRFPLNRGEQIFTIRYPVLRFSHLEFITLYPYTSIPPHAAGP